MPGCVLYTMTLLYHLRLYLSTESKISEIYMDFLGFSFSSLFFLFQKLVANVATFSRGKCLIRFDLFAVPHK